MKWLSVLCIILISTGCSHSVSGYYGNVLEDAQAALDHGDLSRSLELSKRGQNLSIYSSNREWIWKFRIIEAEICNTRRQWDRTVSLLSERLPVEVSNGPVAARVAIDLGTAQAALGKFQVARENFDRAAALCRRPENAESLGILKIALAGLAFREGYSEASESLVQEAVAFAREHRQPFLEASALTFISALLSTSGRCGEAMSWLEPATAISRRLAIPTLLEKNLGNLGWCYNTFGDSDAALAALVEAERISAEVSNLDDRRRWLTNIGNIYEDRDEFSKASAFHVRALNIAREINQPAAIAISLHNLAINAFNRDDFAGAKKYNEEEMRLKERSGSLATKLYGRYVEGHIQDRQGNHEAALATFRGIADEAGSNLSLRWQAQASSAIIYEDALKKPEMAQANYEAFLRTVAMARNQVGRDEFKITFRSGLNRYYSDYIQFLMRQGKSVEALSVAEASRAQVLAERLGVETSSGFTLARAQATATALKTTILSYWLTPEGSYLWVVSPGVGSPAGFAAFTLPSGPEIASLAERHKRAVASSAGVSDTRLYELLVAPAKGMIAPGSRVVVIPDGALHQINFETLAVPGGQSTASNHYWIEDVTVSTATSLALLSQGPRANREGNILLIGDPVSPAPEFPRLPNAALELRSISARFAPNRRAVFEGAAARPSTYLAANPERYSWIHFAAHGVASKESPLDSAIILSNENDSYRLYARDIAKRQVKADLVTISACYSSGSKTFAGEGIVGLAWAFQLAGAHNVIASLWEANDYYTAQLMDGMYERLMAGDDAAHSLRGAKLKLLHSEYSGRHPRYWGAFQLYTGY